MHTTGGNAPIKSSHLDLVSSPTLSHYDRDSSRVADSLRIATPYRGNNVVDLIVSAKQSTGLRAAAVSSEEKQVNEKKEKKKEKKHEY